MSNSTIDVVMKHVGTTVWAGEKWKTTEDACKLLSTHSDHRTNRRVPGRQDVKDVKASSLDSA